MSKFVGNIQQLRLQYDEYIEIISQLRDTSINFIKSVLLRLNKDNEFNDISLKILSKDIELCYVYGGYMQHRNNVDLIFFDSNNEIMISNEDSFDILLDDCANETIFNIGRVLTYMVENNEINFENN